MARLIQAVAKFGPKVELGKRVELEELADQLAQRTGMHPGQALMALSELEATLLHFLRNGRSVRLNGIGLFRPSVGMDGARRIGYRAGSLMKRSLANGIFRATVRNADNAGLTVEAYKALWDAAHPEDPMELPGVRVV